MRRMISRISETAAIVENDRVAGQYYDDVEGVMEERWTRLIWPIIAGSDFSTTLELAPGRGGNTERLLARAARLYAVDIKQTNIDFLNQRFKGVENLSALRHTGAGLDEIDNGSITFAFCFDAMVHFDSDVVRSYIKEFRRVMKPGARAFIHYSACDKNPTGSYRDHPGWRNFMSPALFQHWLAKEGFEILKSAYVAGVIALRDNQEDADAITYFQLPGDAKPSSAGRPKEAETTNRELRERIRELEARLQSIRGSASWRWTAPMRWIRDAFAK
jgi:SAM-dependent methyltransferase